ncbi:PREDICTED: dentin matrix acidic phosphoprotein 1 [Pseudopodoces humilis]|uniref:dentin matrix acidic phosphoprotein 1 n=1 Tax=Pseudopodoces humilis TaxID=181119 RepID=UPI0006B85381|nr:PREDICTED: dentin matrix acidic phosphoprotein 1 [Pseudopodoces humilis]
MTDMRAAFLVLLLWAVACAHPVPGHEPTHSSTLQKGTANEDYIGKLGNHLDGGDGRHPPASPETGENALARELMGENAMDEELGELSGQDVGGRVGQVQDMNQVDHEDMGTHNGNDLGFLDVDARDADNGDSGEHYNAGANGFPSHGGGFLDEEDDSGDDTFDANGEEERGEGPTYVAGADGAGEHEHETGRGDVGAGGGHGESSSSSSESIGADHRRYRNYSFGRTYRHGGASSSSQEEESYDFQDEAMQGDDPSVFDGPGSSYRIRHSGPHALGNSWESVQWAGSHRWEEGDSRSPEVEDGDSGEDSPSVEDNSQSEESVDSQSEEKNSSHSRGDEDDSTSREDENSEYREGTDEQSDEEPRETPELVRTLNEHSNSQTWEGQEDWDSAEDRSVLSTPDSESREEEGEQSKSREDDDDQSQSSEDTVEESEDENDSVPSTSAESPESPEDDSSPEDNTVEDSRSTESDNSESQEDDDDVESHSQEDATHESSSHGDDSSLQSLESGGRKRRLDALRHRPAADYDDNDCQDGY